MPRYLPSVYGPTESTGFGDLGTIEAFDLDAALAAEGSRACCSEVGVRPSRTTERCVNATLEP